ncbi:hypothetical protein LNTAR_19857 [Lentisphaera araneosa HTCC2155]|jgi:2'-5' RNA ligase|uniref:2'-5' RNA ligase n=1 Tax=Lentisphaera araneosa HTCC2155 TaxID=313628 RepID=A6DPR6_9BACT|nr:2'-5' RNA ligase family protein [Lentisphaera araneosa]EDM26361.1 hypothetical protein LNTAR_19857 [Lentisphaera araneosa HTCC2155]
MKTQAAKHQPFLAWHRGRPTYTVWMYQFSDSPLKTLVKEYQDQLKKFIKYHPVENLHLTIAPQGFLVENIELNDETTLHQINERAKELQKLDLAPPKIYIQNIDSFPHCPYIRCSDASKTTNYLQKLLDPENKNFTPHITLGNYLQSKNFTALKPFFESAIPQITLYPSSLDCVAYSTHPKNSVPVCPEDFQTLAKVHFSKA